MLLCTFTFYQSNDYFLRFESTKQIVTNPMREKFKFLLFFAVWLLYPSALLNTDTIGKYTGKGTKILMIYHVLQVCVQSNSL